LQEKPAGDTESRKATAAAKKAAAKAAATTVKASADSGASGAPTVARKRGRPPKDEADRPKLESKHEPAKKAPRTKKEVAEVSEGAIIKAMPKPADGDSNPTPVHYKGGVVYTVVKSKLFRALAVRGDRYTERSASWAPTGKHGSLPAAWKFAINYIENYKKKPKDVMKAAPKRKAAKAKAKAKAKSKP